MKNEIYTWTNRRKGFTNIVERLDRFMISRVWVSNMKVQEMIIPYTGSNHNLIELRISLEIPLHGRPFKFENIWIMESTLTNLME